MSEFNPAAVGILVMGVSDAPQHTLKEECCLAVKAGWLAGINAVAHEKVEPSASDCTACIVMKGGKFSWF